MQIETVKIVSPVSDENPHGYIVINKSDLTDAQELFVDPKDRPKAAAAPVAPAAAPVPHGGTIGVRVSDTPPTRFSNNQPISPPLKKK